MAPPPGRPRPPAGEDEAVDAAPAGRPPGGEDRSRCTQAQLRRFIRSRSYLPLHELRRRFDLGGGPDDVTPIPTPDGTLWVGLPPREAGFLGELLRQGDVGIETSFDPEVRVVVGVYPMRPVGR